MNDEKNPPTAQIVKTDRGTVKEIVVRMTKAEFDKSSECFVAK